jgi:hypothetical protein
MEVNNNIMKLCKLGFTNDVNRIYKSYNGLILIDFCKHQNAKCKLCEKKIPPSVKRWSFGPCPARHICPDCLYNISKICNSKNLDNIDLESYGFIKSSDCFFYSNNKEIRISKRKNTKCKICSSENDGKLRYMGVKKKGFYWHENRSYINICPSCIEILCKESHIDNYIKVYEKWITEKIARKI